MSLAMDKARREEAVRWGLGVFLAVALHVGAAFGVIVWNATRTPPPSPPPAMMIELAALPAAPPPQPSDVPPEPKQEEVEPPLPEPEPEPLSEKVETPPPPKPKVKPEVALPKPPPKPKPRPKQPQPPSQPIEEKTPPPEPVSKPKPPAPAQQSPPASRAEAPAPSASSAQVRKTVQTWQQLLLAHIQRHKRYPSSARRRRQEGVTYLRFVMDREGQVLSARIERSSGYALLDKETQALIERAAPLPAPPPEVSGKQLEFVVPVQFSLR
ncbi:energy transducer TonB [Nitrosococcus wardiae]|uniref:Energy transducer TonB n=1 Tax=Nitrosococcus wardiae TaxID=1814290 RepID=A0A4P7C0X2_9GAMM|nr:energy transducer TonB [Nitrosococcus wardiae]QBQ55227.1 energy transducer TonB [Nitrosococcus wardiae]